VVLVVVVLVVFDAEDEDEDEDEDEAGHVANFVLDANKPRCWHRFMLWRSRRLLGRSIGEQTAQVSGRRQLTKCATTFFTGPHQLNGQRSPMWAGSTHQPWQSRMWSIRNLTLLQTSRCRGFVWFPGHVRACVMSTSSRAACAGGRSKPSATDDDSESEPVVVAPASDTKAREDASASADGKSPCCRWLSPSPTVGGNGRSEEAEDDDNDEEKASREGEGGAGEDDKPAASFAWRC
jgi:hypothetical protein